NYGSYHSFITNASAEYNFNNKISAVISGNFQNRNRTQTSYYDITSNKYVDLDSVNAVKRNPLGTANINERYPHPELAMRKYAVNGFINYNPANKIQLSAAFGAQQAEVQKAFATDSYSANLATAKSE